MHVVATYTQDESQLHNKYVVYVPAGKKATVQATFRNVVKGEKITGEVTDPNGKELEPSTLLPCFICTKAVPVFFVAVIVTTPVFAFAFTLLIRKQLQ